MKHLIPFVFCLLAVAAAGCGKEALQPLHIIPEPAECTQGRGHFTVSPDTRLCFDNIGSADRQLNRTLRECFAGCFGFTPDMGDKDSFGKNAILFAINKDSDTVSGAEGYRLHVTRRNVTASANTAAGLFYAMQTLMQMAVADTAGGRGAFRIPCAEIADRPQFAYRGAHLDVSRHFFDTGFVKKYLDVLAMYKVNKFHWHLTDDHGWRIQIDKYPLLTTVGAWRPDRSGEPWDGSRPPQPGEASVYGGFYTKGQIRDIVAYAAARNIEVIPEIEFPGHCSAILAAYPQFACDDYTYAIPVGPYWPPKAILCAGNDEVIAFCKDVLAEVAALFPSSYIHIGGDEAFNGNWKDCPKCRKRMADENLADESALQQWLADELREYMKTLGKKAIVWDDAVSDDMSGTTAIMCWKGMGKAAAAAKCGIDVIMTPTEHCYFDYYQADKETEPAAIGGYLPLGKAYAFDPMPKGLSETERRHILGGQCNLWTEFIQTPEHAEYMLLPRLCALSECLWSPDGKKDWEHFAAKVKVHQHILKEKGYSCSSRIVKE